MVCQDCQNDHHDLCKGGTWCDCHHKPRDQFPVKT